MVVFEGLMPVCDIIQKFSDFGTSTAVSTLFSCAHTSNLYIKIKTERKNSQSGQ